MKVSRRSPFTGNMNTRDVPCEQWQYDKWCAGCLIQDAMPDMSADDREFLITGYTPEDWEKMFGPEE